MFRQVIYIYTEILGLCKLFLYKLAFGKNFRFRTNCRFSYKSSIRLRRYSSLKLEDSVHISDDCSIRIADKGSLRIGHNTAVSQFCVIACRKSITIGNNVMIGPNVMIYDHDHNFKLSDIMNQGGYVDAPVIIEDNVWIGCGAIILKGVRISSGSVIAAGSVVTSDIPSQTLYYTKPERVFKTISK